MKRLSFIAILFSFLISCENKPQPQQSIEKQANNEISFYTPDSIKIYGDLFEIDKSGRTILLFHQAGSNARGEYGTIIPRLTEKGYNVLAIDQRKGGQAYGSYSRTLAEIPSNSFGDGYGYCDAYNNLESALDFIIESGFTGKKILWGSSYSASLSVQLASKRQADISAALAFSPAAGGSMKDCIPDPYFESIKIPLLLLRPSSEMENERSQEQFKLAESFNHKTYIAQNGVHGSSMLVQERVGGNVEDNWNAVLSFLDEIEK
ncbi:MAG: hypothetical protein NXI20_23130 [bacterium]|nr:hypothetical protein [bacterium]